MLLTKAWAPYFQTGVRSRGRSLAQSGAVHMLPADQGELIRAQVRGQSVNTVIVKQDGGTITPTCDCSHFAGGAYCEHLWAVLLHHEHQAQEDDSITPVQTAPQASFQAPKARKRTDAARPSANRDPEWMNRLALLRPLGSGQGSLSQAVIPVTRQICYLVNIEMCLQNGGLVVELCQRQPTPTGWSKLKPFKINTALVSELPDAQDRELCSMLLGATWAGAADVTDVYRDERSRAVFRLLPGAWRAMLRKLIDTGRCYMGQSETGPAIPLFWDGPKVWVAWLAGDFEDNELVLRLELRRGHESMSIQRPTLVLGGPEGLILHEGKAAPFDDRGAFRWVVQFRDDQRMISGEVEPLRVPEADIQRFLDRLYLLPNLPEVDLPEGLGRPEVRIDPVPHLEIFSPRSDTKASNGKPVRGQLGARVWFAYGQARVLPGQTGRFVSAFALPSQTLPEADDNTEDTSSETLHEALQADAGSADDSTPPLVTAGSLVRRNTQFEQEALSLLVTMGFRQNTSPNGEPLTLPAKMLPFVAGELINRQWVVTADRHAIRGPGAARLSVASGVDWFEVHGGIRYQTENGEQEISLPEILAAARSGQQMIQLGDGSNALLPEDWLREHGLLAAMGKAEGDHLVFKNTQAALLDALLSNQPGLEVDEIFAQTRQRLKEFEGIAPIPARPTFKGDLRPYQQQGLGWMRFLRWFGMGGVLADDMGLGKTVQVLAMLESMYSAPADTDPIDRATERRPSIIVVPRSVVFNWIDEAAKFAPHLRIQAYTGGDREAMRQAFAEQDIIVTSYGLMRRDIAELQEHAFEYVVLDEAQAIKNPDSQSAKAARLLNARFRLALTGTPVENHLGDLWSIFEFLNPGMLGSNTRFAQLVRGGLQSADAVAPADAEDEETDPTARTIWGGKAVTPKSPEGAIQVAQALRPFILRRTKKQVLDDLPEKTEQTILCEMEPAQRETYDQLLKHYRSTLLGNAQAGAAGASSVNGSPMMVLEALLRLRQAACHPGLIDPARSGEPAAKLEALVDRLVELIDEGHKALIFSQFTSMLAIVRKRLEEIGINHEYLDGQTRDRKRHVERFQNDPDCPVFLISLKAGGLGLNLTAAEYVFILDPWWNPAVEAQAIDRAHRIGQTQHVFAYRLICQDTVEQRIAELQEKKKLLADAIIGGEGNMLSNLTREDLEQLLS